MTDRILIQNYEQLDELFRELMLTDNEFAGRTGNANDVWTIDTETDGLRPYHGNRIWGISLYNAFLDKSWYVPIRYLNEWNISQQAYERLLYLISEQANLIFFNADFDLHMLYQDGMPEPKAIEDVMIAAQLLNENEWLSNGGTSGAYKLKRLAKKYLGADAVAGEEQLIANAKARGIDPKSGMWQLPASDVAFYAMKDVEITWQLREKYRPGLEKWGQWQLYKNRSHFLLKSLLRMERNGMRVDTKLIQEHRDGLAPKIQEAQAYFDNLVRGYGIRLQSEKNDPRWINLNSPKQLVTLFQMAGYNVSATNKYVLRDLMEADVPLAHDVVKYRQLAMAEQTYYQPYLYHVDADGIIHHTLNVTGTKTGRLSSSDPNFQNIPRKGNYIVKQVFIPREGYVMVSLDYKALEFRLATHFAQDAIIRKAFADGIDPHSDTARRLNLPRSVAKTLNFGLLYGMGGKKYALQNGISLKEANEKVNAWHRQYPSFRNALAKYEALAKQWRNPDGSPDGKYQFIRLDNGKVKHFNEFLSYPEYEPEYRSAWNFKVQGTAAMVAEESIQRVNLLLDDNDIWKPQNAVHDALMGEIRIDKVAEVLPLIEHAMQDWPMFDPPLAVETSISAKSWYDMVEYKDWDGVS